MSFKKKNITIELVSGVVLFVGGLILHSLVLFNEAEFSLRKLIVMCYFCLLAFVLGSFFLLSHEIQKKIDGW